MTMTPEEIRDLIWDVREKWDIGPDTLAAKLGVGYSAVKMWETMESVTMGPPGDTHTLEYAPPSPETVEALKALQRGEYVDLRDKERAG